MALLTAAQTAAEIKRKATASIPLTNTTNTANNAAYKAAIPAVKTTQPVVPTSVAPKVTTPVATPKVATSGVTVPSFKPTASPIGAAAGAVGATIPAYKAPTAAVTPTPTTTPTTSYVANGGQTLNDILYLKKQYEGGKTGAAQYATPAYAKLDPTLAAQVKGMNATQLEQYISGQNGQRVATPTPAAAETTPATDYRALAQAAYDQQQAQYDASAAANVKELERRNNYSTGITQDNRTLEDASIARNNAPTAWDGSGGYRGAMLDRTRGINDTYTAQGLTDAEAAAYSAANTFRDQSGNFIDTKSNELQDRDRSYNLQVAAQTGILNGQQTMQGAANAASTAGQLLSNANQAISNQIAQIDLTNYPQETALKIKQLDQQVKAGSISNDTAAYQLSQITDPNSTTNQAATLDLQMKQIDASNYSETQKTQLEQLKKTVAEIGKNPYQSDTDKQLDQLKVEQAKLELKKLQDGQTTKAATATDYAVKNIDKLVQYGKKGEIQNGTQLETAILSSPTSEYDQYLMYQRYGLKWDGAVPNQ